MSVTISKKAESSGPRPELRFAFTLLWWEAAFAFAYDTWMSPAYLSGLAGEVGAPVAVVALLGALPWVGQVGQLFAPWGILSLHKIHSFRRYTVGALWISRTLWLVPLGLAAYWGLESLRGKAAFPRDTWFYALAFCSVWVAVFGQSANLAWMSWIRALVPGRFQGRFFGSRQRYTMSGMIAANLLAALWLSYEPYGLKVGYWAVGACALVAGAISTWLLSNVPDAPKGRSTQRWSVGSAVRAAFADRGFRAVMLFAAAFNAAIQFGGPYFPYWFTRDLKIPMSTVAVWAAITNIAAILVALRWGRLIDRVANPALVLIACASGIALSPLFYAWTPAHWLTWVGPIDYFTNGIVWSGYLVASSALLMKVLPKDGNASIAYVSVYVATTGALSAIGVWLGGQASVWLEPWGGFRTLWIVTTLERFAVIIGFGTFLFRTLDRGRAAARPPRG